MKTQKKLSKPVPSIPSKQERRLTVSLYPQPTPTVPWIRLCGLWLAQAGFTPQSRVLVRVMHGCLVLTLEKKA
jgi:toxic protein SymE